ncbi:MAG: N-acetylglucosaminyl-diphospho-decaprenol L-rhamnosyltransferase [Syntrophorhabdus sp. PtaU1.Bin153]|nr:MAG: N-acetylglucosaminyl-diphospho-decaprenol L-rhamnosyltransferase [Syntrophorhabdus sp. PtaU1.Bin153]
MLSIVIITRNTKDLVANLLESIKKDRALEPFLREVILVDNGSSDGTDAMVEERFPGVSLLRNTENRGFAAAANAGIRCSGGEHILLLNSDTLLIEGEVAKMLEFMNSNKDVGICGPQLVHGDMTPQRSYAHIPSLLFEIVPRSFLEFALPSRFSTKGPGRGAHALARRPRDEYRELDPHQETAATPVDVPSLIGAAVMGRRETLDRVGGFDERFFFFLEETDLCLQIKKTGMRVVFFSQSRVIHLQGKTVRKNWVRGRIQYNISLYKFIQKHRRTSYYRAFQAVRIGKCFFMIVLLSVLPFLLVRERTRRTYLYYFELFLWHLRACPDNAGLLASSQG